MNIKKHKTPKGMVDVTSWLPTKKEVTESCVNLTVAGVYWEFQSRMIRDDVFEYRALRKEWRTKKDKEMKYYVKRKCLYNSTRRGACNE